MLNESPHRMNSWVALARRKFLQSPSKPIGTADFDALLGHSVAVTDAAANCFAAELIAAYPDAKVVLNTRRDIDTWHASVMSNIVAVNEDWFKWFLWYITPPLDVELLLRFISWFNADLWWQWHVHQRILWPALFRCSDYRFLRSGVEPFGRTIHNQHSAMIRKLVPHDRLLEWNVEDGWQPLCEFLGKQVPDQPFPRANDKDGFKKRVESDLEALGQKAVMNMLAMFMSGVALLGCLWLR